MGVTRTIPLLSLMEAVVTACDSVEGAPGGYLYAAMMQYVDIHSFENLMGGLVREGCLTKSGQVYHTTDKGRELTGKVSEILRSAGRAS